MIGATVQKKSGIIQDEKNILFQNRRTKTYLCNCTFIFCFLAKDYEHVVINI